MHTRTHALALTAEQKRQATGKDVCTFYPSSPSFTTSKHFRESVKACLIAALAVSAEFKNRRGEQRGSHFKITSLPSLETEHKTPHRKEDERRAETLWWPGRGWKVQGGKVY